MNSILVRAVLETAENGPQHIHTVVELHGIGNGSFNLTNSLRPILREVILYNQFIKDNIYTSHMLYSQTKEIQDRRIIHTTNSL